MAIRIGINGFGRIGRLVFRAATQHGEIETLAVNDLADAKTLSHLLKYDSIHGRYPGDVKAGDGTIIVDDREIRVLSERDPSKLPWANLDVDGVVESTGLFTDKEKASLHLVAGAKKVLISAPAKGDIPTVVLGVNDEALKPTDKVVSNASCTTNCLAPMVQTLHKAFGVEHGVMTTIHSYTNDQQTHDQPHRDLRRARAAGLSMIPTSTGAATAVGKVIPELNGKLDGISVRVPTPDGSLTDFVATLKRSVSAQEVNAAFREAAGGSLKGYLEYCEEEIVSVDIIGNPASCVFDSLYTSVMGGNMVKVLGWYDNEWGYSNRCAELLLKMCG